ncbi:RICIN domain-containing protein [Streptomyces aureoversilis]|uniref:RICIN domain-containing protein n=1 Tax=Streptomyces aureoversilis TaxID=67277 RepID=A0ABV9ZUS2_9ACTN
MLFTVQLDNPIFTNETERLKTQILTLGMRCWVTTNNGADYCKQGAHKGRADSISRWLVDPYTWFDFDVPIGSATDTDKLAHVDFKLIGNPGVGSPAEGDWTSRSGGARCDSNGYVYYGNLSHGCVFDQTVSIFSFVSRKETEHSAKHIREAQLYPDLTIPPVNNKSIPGSIESMKPLTRMRSGKENDYNRDKSTAQCRKWIAKKYHTMPNGPFDCDEYPFASTYEGSWMGNPDRTAMSHFSVRAIPSDDNQQGGRDLNDWYVAQRIIDEDRFYVKVVKQDGSELAVPAPPPPPKTPQGLVTGDMDDDGKPDLLAIHKDGTGKLRFHPGKGDGSLGAGKEIGPEGWANAAVFTHGQDFNGDEEEDVVARVGSDLLLYPGKGDGTIGTPIPFKGYGKGWDPAVRSIVTVSDATNDDYPDIIALLKDQLWLYPGDSSDKPSLLAPMKIGTRGWGDYDIVAAGDRTGDGKADLVARNRQSGMMFLYKGPLNRELKTPPPLPEQTVIRMVNGNSEKCLEIDGSSTRNGALAQQWDCKGQAGAQWQIQPDDGSSFSSVRIVNANSGKCLEVADSRKDNGAPVQQWDCVNSETQKWEVIWNSNLAEPFTLRNRNSGKVIEVDNSSKSNGARVQQWDNAGQRGAKWWFREEAPDSGRIVLTPNQSNATRVFNAENSPLIAAGYDSDHDGRLDIWATRYDGSLVLLRDDPQRHDSDSPQPQINAIKDVEKSGWSNIASIG